MISRVLIVGFGSIGKRHLDIVRNALPEAVIKLLRHDVNENLPELADGQYFKIEDALIFRPQISIIANPASKHMEIALALASAGSHILIEKPISDKLESISDLIKISIDKGLKIQVGYNMRYLKSLNHFRELINSGYAGDVISFRCEVGSYMPSWRAGTDYASVVSARREFGGGVLLELSHEIDYLRWIFGDVESVDSWVGKLSRLKIDVEDTAFYIMLFKSGIVGAVNMDFIRHDKTRTCIGIGSAGSLKWNGVEGSVSAWMSGKNEWEKICDFENEMTDSYKLQFIDFLLSINGAEVKAASIDDGAKVLCIIDALIKSSTEILQAVDNRI